MEISVSGRNVEITPALRAATEEKITRLTKYLAGMDHADVHFWEEKNPRIANKDLCEVTLEGHGHHVRAKVAAPDPLTAVDLVVDKLSGQLHKLKNKIRRKPFHHTTKSNSTPVPASVLIEELIPSQVAVLERESDEYGDFEFDGLDMVPVPGPIVKIKEFALEAISIDDAISRLDLVGHDFYFFRNAETGNTSVIYRRDDGTLGLIKES